MKVIELIVQLAAANPNAVVMIGAPHAGAMHIDRVEDFGGGPTQDLVYVDALAWEKPSHFLKRFHKSDPNDAEK